MYVSAIYLKKNNKGCRLKGWRIKAWSVIHLWAEKKKRSHLSKLKNQNYNTVNNHVFWGNSLWVLSSQNEKCKDTLNFTKAESWRETPVESHEMTRQTEEEHSAKCHAALLCYFLRSISASWSRVVAVNRWRRGSTILMALRTLEWFIIGWGGAETTWANPNSSIWERKAVTQVFISLPLNPWSTPSVEPPLAKTWCVHQHLPLHTQIRTHIVRLVEWPDKETWHYLFFFLCTCAFTNTSASVFESVCVHPLVVFTFQTIYKSWWPFPRCWCLMFLEIPSWYPGMCNYFAAAIHCLFIRFLTMAFLIPAESSYVFRHVRGSSIDKFIHRIAAAKCIGRRQKLKCCSRLCQFSSIAVITPMVSHLPTKPPGTDLRRFINGSYPVQHADEKGWRDLSEQTP